MGTIQPRPGINVFANSSNLISIEQIEDGPPSDEIPIVVVHPEDVDALIELLQQARAELLEPDPDRRLELAVEHERQDRDRTGN